MRATLARAIVLDAGTATLVPADLAAIGKAQMTLIQAIARIEAQGRKVVSAAYDHEDGVLVIELKAAENAGRMSETLINVATGSVMPGDHDGAGDDDGESGEELEGWPAPSPAAAPRNRGAAQNLQRFNPPGRGRQSATGNLHERIGRPAMLSRLRNSASFVIGTSMTIFMLGVGFVIALPILIGVAALSGAVAGPARWGREGMQSQSVSGPVIEGQWTVVHERVLADGRVGE